tara:strand:- start:17604 stop:17834 length:231 start_codon:yes stop_codon:yes gene_type:complete
MTMKQFKKATKDITYKMVKSMKNEEFVTHTKDYYLYKYSEVSMADDSIVVLKENDTDDEIAVVLLGKNKQLLFEML